jgi:hypothetical protein
MPVIFSLIAFLPTGVFGCRTRGLFALLIAFVSGLAAIRTALIGLRGKPRGDPDSQWRVGRSLGLMIPLSHCSS